MPGELSRSRSSDSSGSTRSEERPSTLHYNANPLPIGFRNGLHIPQGPEDDPDSNSGEGTDDEARRTVATKPVQPTSVIRKYHLITPTDTHGGFSGITATVGIFIYLSNHLVTKPRLLLQRPQSTLHPPSLYHTQGFHAGQYSGASRNVALTLPPTYPASPSFRGQPRHVPGRPHGTPTRPASRPNSRARH